MSEKIIEVTKIITKEGVKFYLFITRSRMIIADLFPKASQPFSQGKAIAYGVLGQAVLHARSAREDTGEKKQLRTLLETYEKSRDKNLLDSLSVDQILKADENIKVLETSRIIPYSSLSKVIIKKPGRFRKGKLIITQQVSGTSLSGRKYSKSITRELIVLEDGKLFPAFLVLLQQSLPNLIANQ